MEKKLTPAQRIKQMNPQATIIPESQYRKQLLANAKVWGCDGDIRKILDRYDKLLLNCTNEQERRSISTMGIAEIYKLLGCYGGLSVDGEIIFDAEDTGENSA